MIIVKSMGVKGLRTFEKFLRLPFPSLAQEARRANDFRKLSWNGLVALSAASELLCLHLVKPSTALSVFQATPYTAQSCRDTAP